MYLYLLYIHPMHMIYINMMHMYMVHMHTHHMHTCMWCKYTRVWRPKVNIARPSSLSTLFHWTRTSSVQQASQEAPGSTLCLPPHHWDDKLSLGLNPCPHACKASALPPKIAVSLLMEVSSLRFHSSHYKKRVVASQNATSNHRCVHSYPWLSICLL